jgi:hypothetical protein
VTRLPTALLVSALLRRIESAGGFAAVLHKGDPTGGVILVQCLERGRFCGLFERFSDLDGRRTLARIGPPDGSQHTEIEDYIGRRRRSDPDLWLIELDIADAERFAAETLCAD